ncbi:unnamed protein product, partial [Symbiodinium pilosum]
DKGKCKQIVQEIKGSDLVKDVKAALLDVDSLHDEAWWPYDLKDACLEFVLCRQLRAGWNRLDVTPADIENLKPCEVFRTHVFSAFNKAMTEDAVKSVGILLKEVVQHLQNIRNSVSRASADLTKALQAKQRRAENEQKAQQKKAEKQAEKKAKELSEALKKGNAGNKVCSLLLEDDVRAKLKGIKIFEVANMGLLERCASLANRYERPSFC